MNEMFMAAGAAVLEKAAVRQRVPSPSFGVGMASSFMEPWAGGKEIDKGGGGLYNDSMIRERICADAQRFSYWERKNCRSGRMRGNDAEYERIAGLSGGDNADADRR